MRLGRPMVKREHVPVLLTVAAIGVGVGIGMWLMRDRIRAVAQNAKLATRRIRDPLDVFGADVPDAAFEGVGNHPYMPEGWRPKRGARD
jgi:hypothetical protein